MIFIAIWARRTEGKGDSWRQVPREKCSMQTLMGCVDHCEDLDFPFRET